MSVNALLLNLLRIRSVMTWHECIASNNQVGSIQRNKEDENEEKWLGLKVEVKSN